MSLRISASLIECVVRYSLDRGKYTLSPVRESKVLFYFIEEDVTLTWNWSWSFASRKLLDYFRFTLLFLYFILVCRDKPASSITFSNEMKNCSKRYKKVWKIELNRPLHVYCTVTIKFNNLRKNSVYWREMNKYEKMSKGVCWW